MRQGAEDPGGGDGKKKTGKGGVSATAHFKDQKIDTKKMQGYSAERTADGGQNGEPEKGGKGSQRTKQWLKKTN